MAPACSRSENELLHSFQRDPKSFDQWAAFHQSIGRYIAAAAVKILFKRAGTTQDAEDILQTVYRLLVDPGRQRFNPDRSSARAYLMGIIGNAEQEVFHRRGMTRQTRTEDSGGHGMWRRRRLNKERTGGEGHPTRAPGKRRQVEVIAIGDAEYAESNSLASSSQNQYARSENQQLIDILLEGVDPLVCRVFSELADDQEGERRAKGFRIEDLAKAHNLSRDQLNHRIREARSIARKRLAALGLEVGTLFARAA